MSKQHPDAEVVRSIDEAAPRRASFYIDPIQPLQKLSVSPIRSVLGAIGAIFRSGDDVISLASGQGTKERKSYLCTDSGNAELFAKLHGENVRFDHKQQRWLLWDDQGGRWAEDRQGCVRGRMKTTARERLRNAVERPESDGRRKREIKWALDSESRYGIDAALELAKSESPVRDSGDGWDANPLLFGVANGVVDLQTGTLRKGRRTDLITKSSPVTFNPDAACPRFVQFISEIFGNDKELTGFVQKAVGYSLTGSVQEQCLFACYGEGRNGKSTLLEIVLYILGDYGVDLPSGSLEVKRGSPGEGVNLPGSRFAKSVEIREGRRLDEARVKSWTGGDTISVRPLYRNAFSFQPTHKIWLAFNHKPVITDDSPGMWRRIRLIPFLASSQDRKPIRAYWRN
jgi:putative DNA primase/helicase